MKVHRVRVFKTWVAVVKGVGWRGGSFDVVVVGLAWGLVRRSFVYS